MTDHNPGALAPLGISDVQEATVASIKAVDAHIDALRSELEKAVRLRRAMAEAIDHNRGAGKGLSSVLQEATRAEYESPPDQKMPHRPPSAEETRPVTAGA